MTANGLTDERAVIEIIERAVRERVPVTVAGAHSGLTGAGIPKGGWVLSLEKFTRLEIAHGHARVGAAVSLLALRDAAARSRQFYAPDPTEITASVGGTIATNASGSRSFLYGSTRRHVNALRVVHMDGRVIDYSLPNGPSKDPALQRSIENYLLFTQFTPVRNFGQPVQAKVRISFQSSRIEVKG